MKKKIQITLILLILALLISTNILIILMSNHWSDAVAVMLGGLIAYVSEYFLKKNK
jgi:uncharacterized membrane protein YjjB (DUF3815 family)